MTWQQRLEAAKTEIARRKVIAEWACPGPWDAARSPFGSTGLGHGGVGHTVQASRSDTAHACANDPAHVLRVLEIHRLILALVDPWLLNRLDRPSPMTQLVCAVLDLYAPETAHV